MERSHRRWRRLRVAGVVAGALLLGLQLVPVGRARTNPPVTEEVPWPSARAEEIAERSCAACHSNTTQWPWYAHVAPMSWLVVHDVEEGRDEMNVSTWDRDAGEADDAIEAIVEGTMPPRRYLLLHPSARLTDEERQVLVDAFRVLEERR